MTDKELRKLKRADFLEILFYLRKEVDELRQENESLKQQLEKLQGGISDESVEKITGAVKEVVEEYFRGHSDNNMTISSSPESEKSGK